MSEFLSMGGYAVFVWPCYFLFISVLTANLLAPIFKHRKLQIQLNKQWRRENS